MKSLRRKEVEGNPSFWTNIIKLLEYFLVTGAAYTITTYFHLKWYVGIALFFGVLLLVYIVGKIPIIGNIFYFGMSWLMSLLLVGLFGDPIGKLLTQNQEFSIHNPHWLFDVVAFLFTFVIYKVYCAYKDVDGLLFHFKKRGNSHYRHLGNVCDDEDGVDENEILVTRLTRQNHEARETARQDAEFKVADYLQAEKALGIDYSKSHDQ